jgi:hypothetical protein
LHRDDEMIEITGIRLETTKKFRDIARTHRAAIVIDAVLPPWQPRGIEIRGRAEALTGSSRSSACTRSASSPGASTRPIAAMLAAIANAIAKRSKRECKRT